MPFSDDVIESLDDGIQSNGFADMDEFVDMVNKVDLTTCFHAFKRWQDFDGSKRGLLNVIAGKEYDAD